MNFKVKNVDNLAANWYAYVNLLRHGAYNFNVCVCKCGCIYMYVCDSECVCTFYVYLYVCE